MADETKENRDEKQKAAAKAAAAKRKQERKKIADERSKKIKAIKGNREYYEMPIPEKTIFGYILEGLKKDGRLAAGNVVTLRSEGDMQAVGIDPTGD